VFSRADAELRAVSSVQLLAGSAWSLLVGFHPAARGRAIVEAYQAAAEKYGYIVAGSNNSRNGPWQVSATSIQAMSADLGRFNIDPKRFYLTGLSGGARVAMGVAAGTKAIAGVIRVERRLPGQSAAQVTAFAVYGRRAPKTSTTSRCVSWTGVDDSSSSRGVRGGAHAAAGAGRDGRDRVARAAGDEKRRETAGRTVDRSVADPATAGDCRIDRPAATVRLLQELASDFGGLRDVAGFVARAAELSKQKDVKTALSRERAEDDAEARQVGDVFAWRPVSAMKGAGWRAWAGCATRCNALPVRPTPTPTPPTGSGRGGCCAPSRPASPSVAWIPSIESCSNNTDSLEQAAAAADTLARLKPSRSIRSAEAIALLFARPKPSRSVTRWSAKPSGARER
jgi:hypothetical protein